MGKTRVAKGRRFSSKFPDAQFKEKNKSHKLKKNVLSSSKAEGGLEVLDFIDTEYP